MGPRVKPREDELGVDYLGGDCWANNTFYAETEMDTSVSTPVRTDFSSRA